MRTDCHIHAHGHEKSAAILAEMDRRQVDVIGVMSPTPEANTAEAHWEAFQAASKMASQDRERIRMFARINPTVPGAVDLVERAITELSLSGVKMLPDHWFPYEERFFPLYEKIQELRVPILFHSGILWGNADSSRFCRPVDYEALQLFPRIRFALAHVSWPWTDECIAVADRFLTTARRADGRDPDLARDVALRFVNLENPQYKVDCQMLVDTTRGTPPNYRKEVLATALAVLGPDLLIFGSDTHDAEDLSKTVEHMELDTEILRELGRSDQEIDAILGSNFLKLFQPLG